MKSLVGAWLTNPATQRVLAALTQSGAQAFFVGGCVRNALLGVQVGDIDIATDAHPPVVMELAKASGIKAIPTGIDHGTVTLVSGGIAHEVTTFRRDVATDGRRAVVAFSDQVSEDAARRDFTMNALYAGADGHVHDPIGGLPDLLARRVRFIGDANDRIAEDYLRSLRYFRFQAWYGDPDGGMDADALAAISANLAGLETLSRERVGTELLKLLAALDPVRSVAAMRACGVLSALLPGSDDRALGPLVHLEQMAGLNPDPIRRLGTLGRIEPGSLRLSRVQSSHLSRISEGATGGQSPGELGYRLKLELARDALILRAAMLDSPWSSEDLDLVRRGAGAVCPVAAKDLAPHLQGAALGARLRHLEQVWITSGFTLSRADLLDHPD